MKKIFGILLLSLITLNANAVLMLEIERLSDTQANITGTGIFDTVLAPTNNHVLSLEESLFATTSSGNPSILDSGALFWASAGAYSDVRLQDDLLYMFAAIPTANDLLSGSVSVTLPTGWTFSGAGSSGAVYNGFDSVDRVLAGSWEITTSESVPEPSIIALFAAGLFGLGFARRRKA